MDDDSYEYSDYEGGDDSDIDEFVADADELPDEPVPVAPVDSDDEEAPAVDSDEEAVEIESDVEAEPEEEIEPSTVSEYNREIVIVAPENHQTSDMMTRFEITEYISNRAAQIAQYNNCMVDTTGLSDPIKMAQRELSQRKSPLLLKRYVGDRKNPVTGVMEQYYEQLDPNVMAHAVTFDV